MGVCEGNLDPTLQSFVTGINTPTAEGGTAKKRRSSLCGLFIIFEMMIVNNNITNFRWCNSLYI